MTPWVPVVLAAGAGALAVAAPPVGRSRLAGLAGGSPRSTVERRLRTAPVPALAAGVALVLLGPVAAVVAAGASFVALGRLAARRTATTRATERVRALEALAVLAGDLRVGRAPAAALAAAASVAVGGTAATLTAAAVAAELGGDVPAALRAGQGAVPEVLRGLAACWTVCTASGSGLAAAVDRLCEGLRAAEAQRRAVAAELAGPQATAGLLALLPVGGLAMAAALGAHPLHVLLHTTAGVVCLLLGGAFDAAGLLWTSRLVARAGGA